MKFSEQISCDVLVAGAGLAGIRAAYDCAQKGLKVLWIAKAMLCSGASFYPLTAGLGCQMPDSDEDRDVYLEELLDTGLTMADREMCKAMVYEIREEEARMGELGIKTSSCTGRAACFAKRERTIRDWGNWEEIRENVTEIFGNMPNVRTMAYCDLLRILKTDGKVSGAVLCDHDSRLLCVSTPAIVLATGGYCGLYQHALNTEDVCGEGHSLALDAGADLINMEFMQFIPGLTDPIYKQLFSEVTLWHCTDLQDQEGNSILARYLPEGVSFKDCMMDRSMHGPFSTNDRSRYFEQAMMEEVNRTGSEKGFKLIYDEGYNTEPNVYYKGSRDIYRSKGLDLVNRPISILPFAHCANGGVHIDIHASTRVPGLFAAGETAGGLHGADPHGGAATAACLVYGAHAARSAVEYVKNAPKPHMPDGEEVLREFMTWIDTGVNNPITPHEILAELKKRLWRTAGVIRKGDDLRAFLTWIQEMRRSFNAKACILSGFDLKLSLKAFHALRTAEALVTAILGREESRGPHYRVDFPNREESLNYKRLSVEEKDGAISAQYV